MIFLLGSWDPCSAAVTLGAQNCPVQGLFVAFSSFSAYGISLQVAAHSARAVAAEVMQEGGENSDPTSIC